MTVMFQSTGEEVEGCERSVESQERQVRRLLVPQGNAELDTALLCRSRCSAGQLSVREGLEAGAESASGWTRHHLH